MLKHPVAFLHLTLKTVQWKWLHIEGSCMYFGANSISTRLNTTDNVVYSFFVSSTARGLENAANRTSSEVYKFIKPTVNHSICLFSGFFSLAKAELWFITQHLVHHLWSTVQWSHRWIHSSLEPTNLVFLRFASVCEAQLIKPIYYISCSSVTDTDLCFCPFGFHSFCCPVSIFKIYWLQSSVSSCMFSFYDIKVAWWEEEEKKWGASLR